MPEIRLWPKIANQKDAYTSSWSVREVIALHIWRICWLLLYRSTPKHFFNRWRLFILRVFGCKVEGQPFVFPSSKIFAPWLLHLGIKCCLGPHSEIYNLGPVYIGARTTISQYCYICNGSHDFSKENLPLLIGNIKISNNAFLGAKSIVLPGINIGEYAIVGAGAVVTKDVEPWTVVGGNPAKFIKKRVISD